MGFFGAIKTTVIGVKDIVLKVNSTVWETGEGAQKAARMVKTSVTTSSFGISTYNAAEDFVCNDRVCFILSFVGAACDATTLICGNIPITKGVTVVTIPISVGCKSTRAFCKKFGTLPGCNN